MYFRCFGVAGAVGKGAAPAAKGEDAEEHYERQTPQAAVLRRFGGSAVRRFGGSAVRRFGLMVSPSSYLLCCSVGWTNQKVRIVPPVTNARRCVKGDSVTLLAYVSLTVPRDDVLPDAPRARTF